MRSGVVLCLLLATSPALARPSVVARAEIDGDAWLVSGKVFVDGVPAPDLVHENGTWESLPVSVKPGRHVIRIELDDGRIQQRTVDVAEGDAGDVVLVHFPPLAPISFEQPRDSGAPESTSPASGAEKRTGPAWWTLAPLGWGVIATAAGIAGMASGTGMHSHALALETYANAWFPGSCTTPSTSSTIKACAKAARLESKAVNSEIGGGLAIGFGTSVVIASVIGLVLSFRGAHGTRQAWKVTPLLSPELAGLGLSMRF